MDSIWPIKLESEKLLNSPLLNITSVKFDGKEIEGVADFSFETQHMAKTGCTGEVMTPIPCDDWAGNISEIDDALCSNRNNTNQREAIVFVGHSSSAEKESLIHAIAERLIEGGVEVYIVKDDADEILGRSLEHVFIDDVKHMEDVQRKLMENQPKEKRTDLKLNACRRRRGKR